MTLRKICELGLIKEDTEIFIRQGDGFYTAAHGNLHQADVVNYMDTEVECFTWQDDNKFYIDLK